MPLARPAALLLAALIQLAPGAAAGQAATALDRFDPAPPSDALFSVPSAGVEGELRPGAAVVVSYAAEPLVVRSADGDELAWVDHQLVLHALASVELWRRLEIDVDAPFTLDQGGDSGAVGAVTVQAPEGAELGDLRVGGRVALLRQQGGLPAAALRLSAWLPTGDEGAFSGTGSARYAAGVVVGAEHRAWLWAATLGARLQEASSQSFSTSETFGGAGVGG